MQTSVVNSSGGEFNTKVQTGSHQITALVELPIEEKKCILPFADQNKTILEDILFLLSLFTQRNVFTLYENNNNTAIISDHRLFNFGGQFALSTKPNTKWKHKETGEIKSDSEMGNIPVYDWDHIDLGFEETLNKVFSTISSESWQRRYEGGYFLFLFKSMLQRQILDTSFLLGWTIWEHIFAIKNRGWLDNKAIEIMQGEKKISFILNKFFLKKIDDTARKNILRINKTRNRLVHFGIKTESVDMKEMTMFVRLTDQLMAIILELEPSNLFNSFEDLEIFLNRRVCTIGKKQH